MIFFVRMKFVEADVVGDVDVKRDHVDEDDGLFDGGYNNGGGDHGGEEDVGGDHGGGVEMVGL